MKGFWVWPSDAEDQTRMINQVRGTALAKILDVLSTNRAGLSNAQLDEFVEKSSQWDLAWVLRQLLALGFVEYRVNVFGDSGRYLITASGEAALERVVGK